MIHPNGKYCYDPPLSKRVPLQPGGICAQKREEKGDKTCRKGGAPGALDNELRVGLIIAVRSLKSNQIGRKTFVELQLCSDSTKMEKRYEGNAEKQKSGFRQDQGKDAGGHYGL